MSHYSDCVHVDSPNIPLICQPEDDHSIFGQFIPNKPDGGMVEDIGPFSSKDMYLPNFTLRTFEGRIPRDAVFYDQHGSGTGMLGSCIFFKGRIQTELPGDNHRVVSFNGSQNFKFDPENELRHVCKADTELNFLHISITSRFFHQLLPDNERWADHLKTKIEKRQRIIGKNFAAITLAQQKALANIFETPLTGKLGYMMIETSVIQIILLQLYLLFHCEEAYKEPGMSKRDAEIAQELKEYLNKTYLENHTISDLAQYFGTNTNKLMNVFRKVFGKSIFEYISEQRMEHAFRLLRDDGLLVTEVSRNVGYKNPNHFSTAFKKKFGINPSVFRN
jgi:AraC-like DNA-binding protein